MHIEIICQQCSQAFIGRPTTAVFVAQKYCSRKCANAARRTGQTTKCLNCQKNKVYESVSHRANGGGKFCSHACRNSFQKGPNHPCWKDGISAKSEYVSIWRPNHPRAAKRNRFHILEHRIIVEEYIGRYLTTGETVHHINEVKKDNRPKNLYLFESRGAHTRYHMLLRAGKVERIIDSNLDRFADELGQIKH